MSTIQTNMTNYTFLEPGGEVLQDSEEARKQAVGLLVQGKNVIVVIKIDHRELYESKIEAFKNSVLDDGRITQGNVSVSLHWIRFYDDNVRKGYILFSNWIARNLHIEDQFRGVRAHLVIEVR